ncbi:ABC transporter permease [Eubacterium sp.]|uniref:ABC transporter permease n=1 Tax=Eubacterium sp. TaxID=142586 RepID=UPI003522B9A8
MGKLKKLLKLRKQSDTVKLIMLIMILGIAMLIGVFYEGVKIYIDLQNEVEYIIVPQSNPVTKRQIDELRQIDNVKCVTPQKEKNVTVYINGKNSLVKCFQISEEYMDRVYGIERKKGMQNFYLTEQCYEEIKNSALDGRIMENKFKSKYVIGEKTGIAEFNCIKINDKELNCGFTCEKSSYLYGEDSKIRVCVSKSDFTGATTDALEKAGYSIENKEKVIEIENDRNIKLIRIKYQLLIVILCFVYATSTIKMLKIKKV